MRLGLAGIAVLLALALPAGASGATLYVEKGGVDTANNCLNAGNPCLTVQHAVNEASPEDTIQIGPGEFVEAVATGKVLTFQGAGPGTVTSIVGATRVRGTEGTSSAGKPAFELPNGGTLRNLQAVGGSGSNIPTAQAGGPGVRFQPSGPATLRLEDTLAMGGNGGLDFIGSLPGGAALEVNGPSAPAQVLATGSSFFAGTGGLIFPATSVVIRGEQVQADFSDSDFGGLEETDPPGGLEAAQGADVSLEDSRVVGLNGVAVLDGATLSVERSLVLGVFVGIGLTATAGEEVEADAHNSAVVGVVGPAAGVNSGSGTSSARMSAQGSTFYSREGVGAIVVEGAAPGGPAEAHLINSIARAVGTGENVRDLIANEATITAAFSSFTSVGGSGNLPTPGSANNISGDPRLMVTEEELDFRLRPDSPLIDRGDPSVVAPGELDLDRNPRSLDGNGDCLAAPDIGAFELTGHEATCLADAPPTVSGFRVTNKAFAPKGKSSKGKRRRARAGASAKGKRRKVKRGTTFVYRLSEPARVTITIERKARGRRVGKGRKARCVKPRRGKSKPRCVRFVKAGALSAQKNAGRQTTPFSGRLRGKALKPGRYRATIVATDSAGQRSQPRRVSFRVVRG